jgi:hypothetical protein
MTKQSFYDKIKALGATDETTVEIFLGGGL